MNLLDVSAPVHRLVFRCFRAVAGLLPGGRILAFGTGDDMIGSILVVNLDRQPQRWRLLLREIGRFRAADGTPLTAMVRRLAAVDARDGRAVAATADVDPMYRLADQLHVQPDPRLAECFDADEPVRMTRQEVAVARSHVEVWKAVATGTNAHVLVLEDDVWFRPGAAAAIDRAWHAAVARCRVAGGPRLLYLSYDDAGETAERADACGVLFRPVRGLWFLSGYVLSREGAASLLRAMPVVGPVDMWVNRRFGELGALASSSPVILQRRDCASDNSYSVLPFLARAGIVDAASGLTPSDRTRAGRVLAWTAGGEREGLAMALSMLGLRVRVFDDGDPVVGASDLRMLLVVFDALVDVPLSSHALSAVVARREVSFLVEPDACLPGGWKPERLPSTRTVILPRDGPGGGSWDPFCDLLGLDRPVQACPVGARRDSRLFRDGREDTPGPVTGPPPREACPLDASPWILPPRSGWRPGRGREPALPSVGEPAVYSAMTRADPSFPGLVGTFPGNLAAFSRDGLLHDGDGARLVIDEASTAGRRYRSGAFASSRSFGYGRFQARIRAAPGAGLVTGFFLHRDAPRQEIDLELMGDDPQRMLVNVYFNPGDEGAAMSFGYRGTPWRVDLGLDATQEAHVYAIDWRPGSIIWSVDGRVVHRRVGWDPTPIPHLPMRLHGNLWAPRSERLAGRMREGCLPATASFRDVGVWA